MKITIDIPDNIASPLDDHLKTLRGDAAVGRDGSVTIPPRFPAGIKDWIGEIVKHNVRELAAGTNLPVMTTLRNEIRQREQQLDAMFKPSVT